MIIVLTVVAIILIIVGVIIYRNFDWDGAEVSFTVLGVFMIVGCIIAGLILANGVRELNIIDDKIAMYEEENTKIETQIAEAVKQYQEYEHDIFVEVAPESAVTLVSLYPELKADTLVQKQIEVYIANNEKIKELKESKISGSVKKWWLYFGG